MEGTHPALTVVLALAAGVFAQSLARHVRVPGIVLLLVAGAALGPDGIGWVQPGGLGDGMFAIVDLAVAVILFEGGLNLEISRLRRTQAPIRRLVTFGALVTLLGGTLAVRALLEWDWARAILFGSLVVVTGPTVVGPLISDLRLRPKVATVLEAEGVLIDPIGAILAVLVLELVLAPGADAFASGTLGLALSLGFGVAAGALAGMLIASVLRIRSIVPEGYGNIVVLASVLLLFQSCNQLVPHSGILAVAIAGVAVGNIRSPVDRDLREFKDQLSVLLIGLLFVLLAADIRLADVQALGWGGLGVVALLVLVVRPIGVFLSTLTSDLSARERLFIAWVAPRGIVAAAIASLTAVALQKAGLEGGAELRALVFLTIGGTVLLAGLTGLPVAAVLGQRLPGRDVVAILGAGGMGLALAKVLRDADVPVVFLDANPHSCRRAEEDGFAVVWGDAIQERTMTRARFDRVKAAIGLTANQTLNGVFVTRARQLFHVPRGYVAATRRESGRSAEGLRSAEADILFEGPHDVERWDVRARHGDLVLEEWSYRGEPAAAKADAEGADAEQKPGERFAMLAFRRGGRTLPMWTGFEAREGDVVSVAVHVPDREEAHRILAALGWEPHPPPSDA
ncbi:MAG: sodium:proton antiporter [Deltaproteobacteria bacterium]|nr:MAG: sodium:proton antiporter [Deltaproteobacteria bacterium]